VGSLLFGRMEHGHLLLFLQAPGCLLTSEVESLKEAMDIVHLIFVKGVSFPVNQIFDSMDLIHNSETWLFINEFNCLSISLQ